MRKMSGADSRTATLDDKKSIAKKENSTISSESKF